MPSPCDPCGLRGTLVLLLRRGTHRDRIVLALATIDRSDVVRRRDGERKLSDLGSIVVERAAFPSVEMYCIRPVRILTRSTFHSIFDLSLSNPP